MAMGTRRKRERPEDLWIVSSQVVGTPAHVFYDRLNQIFDQHHLDRTREQLCRRYYKGRRGRPSITPGVYFRALLLGYLEGIDSERGLAWRLADSLSLRKFIAYTLTEETPDHSTLSRTRRLYSVETHRAVFRWVLKILAEEGLVEGKTVSIDATTLEANAALRSLVRRDNGQKYDDYLTDLASGALLAITVQGADQGDTTTIHQTLAEAGEAVAELIEHEAVTAPAEEPKVNLGGVEEVVADKGYHSGAVVQDLHAVACRSYIPEPERGRRNWEGKEDEQKQVYANRRRIQGARSKQLQRKRSELTERSMAHLYETGGMRRLHLKGRTNILKRLLVHAGGFNLALIMRKLVGVGKPRRLQGAWACIFACLGLLLLYVWSMLRTGFRFNIAKEETAVTF